MFFNIQTQTLGNNIFLLVLNFEFIFIKIGQLYNRNDRKISGKII